MRRRQAAAAASTKHTTASASPINLISAIRACPAAPAEILAALDQIEQVLLDCSRIYTLPDCNLDLKQLKSLLLANPGKILFRPSSSIPADHLTSGEYFPTACYHNDQPHKRSFISGFFDPLEQWELQHAAFSAPIMLCQPINHYRHSPLHQDYGTAINVLLQSPTNQQLFKLWVVLVPSNPTAIIPTLNPLSFAQAMALEVGPSCTYTARICFALYHSFWIPAPCDHSLNNQGRDIHHGRRTRNLSKRLPVCIQIQLRQQAHVPLGEHKC
ncbi:hypothetical protein BDR26DRAFT_901746 [Obelidium mucronatum]|nr:hypothetical protein BDR26DRAFT_901746 [Obelidium mucronatum]